MPGAVADGADDRAKPNLDIDDVLANGPDATFITTLRVRDLDGRIVEQEVGYGIRDGKAITQGDIVLGNVDEVARRDQRSKALRPDDFAAVIADAGATWPGGIVPYEIGPDMYEAATAVAAYFAAHTPIQMRRRTADDAAYVLFRAGTSNEAQVGWRLGINAVTLSQNASLGTAIHEMCHVLGMWHEHCRSDRDAHIRILWNNIDQGSHDALSKLGHEALNATPYDIASITHYKSVQLARAGTWSMETLDGREIGPREGLSAGDLQGLRTLYPDLAWHH